MNAPQRNAFAHRALDRIRIPITDLHEHVHAQDGMRGPQSTMARPWRLPAPLYTLSGIEQQPPSFMPFAAHLRIQLAVAAADGCRWLFCIYTNPMHACTCQHTRGREHAVMAEVGSGCRIGPLVHNMLDAIASTSSSDRRAPWRPTCRWRWACAGPLN